MAEAINKLRSLKAGDTRLLRRAYADVTAATVGFDPTVEAQGYSTGSSQKLHVTFELPDAASSIVWSLHTWSPAAELWRVHPTAPTTATKAQSPDASEIEICGAAKVLIVFASPVNMTAGANVWFEVNSF